MKNFLARIWDGLFPVPVVSSREAFVLRVALATALFWFFPQSIPFNVQPIPVGVAHWVDLTWLANPGVFPIYRAVFFALLVLFASGFMLPVTLPLLTLVHILPPTLHNSQGFTYHGNQIVSLSLLGLTVMTLWFAVTGRANARGAAVGAKALVIPLIAVVEGLAVWFIEKTASLISLGWHLSPTMPLSLLLWVDVALFVLVFLLAMILPSLLLKPWTDAGSPPAIARGWFLLTAQFVTASAYLISVFSKFIRSDGQWLKNSFYVALDFVKTLRQNYYSGLDPKYAVDPPAYIVTMMQHPVITAFFFDVGVALEAFMIFAIGYRRATFAFGACLIVMHLTIAKIMNLFFPTHVVMLAIFWVAPVFFGGFSKSEKAH